MLIGELCTKSGLSRDTIRHYESIGLLHPKLLSAGSRLYRHYDETSLERLELIQIGRKSGMILREMKPILENLMAGSISFDGQRQVIWDQLARVDERIEELHAAKKLLQQQFKRIEERENQTM